MSEERLERMEMMISDLIRIVGRTNAMVEETRDELGRLKDIVNGIDGRFEGLESRFESLESRFEGLESRFESLEGRFEGLESRFDSLENRFDSLLIDMSIIKSATATKEDMRLLNERLDLHMEKLARQEEDIYRLKRLVGIK
ncbi:MAG: DUF2730 domain-containing protein [Firmicutes bacterium]|nr:DUF2730 domain-containing protein [Bacillota bacterium]